MNEDPYEVLGVARDASPDQIKSAYRILAMRSHPDHHPGNPAAEEEFKRVDRAYTILSDPERKAEYDRASAGPSESSTSQSATSWGANAEPPAEAAASDSWRPVRRGLDIVLILAGVAILAVWRMNTQDPAAAFLAVLFHGTRYRDDAALKDLIALAAGFGLPAYGVFRLFIDDSE